VGTYARHLLAALGRRRRPEDAVTGFVAAGRSREAIPAEHVQRFVDVPGPSRGITFLDGWRMPRLLARERVDVFHSLFYALPSSGVPGVRLGQTVHDLTPILFPDGFSRRQRLVFRSALRRSRDADRVVAVSENTREDLVRLLSVRREQVEVIPPGIDPVFFEAPSPARLAGLRRSLGFEGPYWVHAGGYDPIKNLPLALAALAALRAEGCKHRLVITGDPGPNAPAFLREVQRLQLQDAVLQAGWLAVEDLAALYSGAEVMVYPSRYEGFGFPPLEAMACGAPVVAGRAGSLPEVLGDVCPLVDPDDAGGLARELRLLLADPDLRAQTARRGRERAAEFRWEATADRTWELYRRLAAAKMAC
jgi:glycosyltransferase involved in cell wall biosynthesis